MSKGFLWFAQNNDTTDYVKCSIALAKSIKQHNKENERTEHGQIIQGNGHPRQESAR